MSRIRSIQVFLVAAVSLSLIVSACGSSDPTATPNPTATPQPTATPAPTPTAAPTPTPVPGQATATPQPTPTPQPTATPIPATPTPEPVPEGSLRVAFGNIDFRIMPEATSSRPFNEYMFTPVVGSTAEGELDQSGVALEWSSNADFSVWTAKLRTDAVFHNGEPVTSADVAYGYEFFVNDDGYTRSNEVYLGELEVETPDPTTVVVTLPTPDFLFAHIIWSPVGTGPEYVLPANYLRSVGGDAFNRAPVGSGPWEFVEAVVGNRIVYEGVEDHWYYGNPRFQFMELLLIPEEPTRVALLRSGRAEIIELGRARGGEIRDAGFNVFNKPGAAVGSVFINEQYKTEYNGVPNPLNNVKVRTAMSLAIDRQVIVDTFMLGFAEATVNYPLVSWDVAYQKFPVPDQDIARARELLAEAGYGPGNPATIEVRSMAWSGLPEGPEIMEAVSIWWEDAGIDVVRRPGDLVAYRTPWFSQGFDAPSVGGVIFISNRLVASLLGGFDPTAASRLTEDPELHAVGEAWTTSATLDEYIRNGRVVQELVLEKWSHIPMFEAGNTMASKPDVATSWNMGKVAYSFRLGEVAQGNTV